MFDSLFVLEYEFMYIIYYTKICEIKNIVVAVNERLILKGLICNGYVIVFAPVYTRIIRFRY